MALSDTPLAAWEARPNGRELEYARAVIAAGERHAVFRVATAPLGGGEPAPFDYVAHLERGFPPFAMERDEAPPGRGFVTPGRICLPMPDGRLVEEDVFDVGGLLREWFPADAGWAMDFMAPIAPVQIWSRRGSVRIDLKTDLWFPRVIGILDEEAAVPPAPPDRDNAAAARCHTPRLNSFLDEIAEAATGLGGEWTLREPEGIAERYAEMTGERGILLD